jgi:hypothetical protein
MAFREFRSLVQLEFVVVREAPSSSSSRASTDADFIVFFDARGGYKAQDVPKVVAPLLEGRADVAYGLRSEVPVRARATSLLMWLVDRALRVNVSDGQTGLRAFRREVAGLPKAALRVAKVPIYYREEECSRLEEHS